MSDDLFHYGIKRKSGRYPWGSGENPYQRMKSFQSTVKDMRKDGLKDTEIAKQLNMSTTQLRARLSIASDEVRKMDIAEVQKLKSKGLSNVAIAEKMGYPESTIRNYLKSDLEARANITRSNADILADQCKNRGPLDIGAGVEKHMGISKDRLKTAVEMLKDDGYEVYNLQVEQLGTGKYTTVKVLAPPGSDYATISKNRDKIQIPNVYSEDGGQTIRVLEPPRNVSSKRIKINYAEEGGIDKDGLIELRRGVDELSLGKARYAQVRIAVDGTHYLKGMATYSDNMPDGVDIIFNTNKKVGTPKEKVFKEMKTLKDGSIDLENPFGASIRRDNELMLAQRHYKDKNGKEQLSALNIVNEEGDWGRWSKNLPSQFLSKQYNYLIKRQLGLTYQQKEEEYKEIMSLTNPVIKKKLLTAFADECDGAAVHLKGAAMPRQATHVLLPFPEMKEKEVYAPNYRNGEEVALVRFPHGGTFEIPVLTVNNKVPKANSLIKNAPDAIGINPKVASQLSGADFDGDNVLVIPLRGQKIKHTSPLEGLKDFDPKASYPAYEGMQRMSKKSRNTQMGKVSNLITDMTLRGADESELCMAVKHSMVVIDAEKHNLDWRKSAVDHNIAALKKKYQGASNAGASTLISRASSEIRVPAYSEKIDPSTGKIIRVPTGKTRRNKQGEYVEQQVKVTKMLVTDDAHKLSSGTRVETIYADHANKLKNLANESRKAAISIKPYTVSSSAKETYKKEVASLTDKLDNALKNAPLERKAQLLANKKVSLRIQNDPDMDSDKKKKIRGQELNRARAIIGAKKELVDVTDREWEAIQAHAVSSNLLTKIMNNTDLDKLKERATPRTTVLMTPAKIAIAKSRLAMGYDRNEIADALGVSPATLNRALE